MVVVSRMEVKRDVAKARRAFNHLLTLRTRAELIAIRREAEPACVHAIPRDPAAQWIHQVTADVLPMLKNDLVKAFLPRPDYDDGEDGRYRRDLCTALPQPAVAFPVAVERW